MGCTECPLECHTKAVCGDAAKLDDLPSCHADSVKLTNLLARALCKTDVEAYERGYNDCCGPSCTKDELAIVIDGQWEAYKDDARKLIEQAC